MFLDLTHNSVEPSPFLIYIIITYIRFQLNNTNNNNNFTDLKSKH